MADALACGRRFRTFNVVEDFNREALHIEVDIPISSSRLIRLFEQLKHDYGLPRALRTDNGPEFLDGRFVQWATLNGMAIGHIQPGSPTRMPTLNAATGPFAKRSWTSICWPASTMCAKPPIDGCPSTTRSAPHGSLDNLHPPSTATTSPDVLLLKCLLDGELTLVLPAQHPVHHQLVEKEFFRGDYVMDSCQMNGLIRSPDQARQRCMLDHSYISRQQVTVTSAANHGVALGLRQSSAQMA